MEKIGDAAQLRAAILARYDALSPRLQLIAQLVLDDPHSVGVETLAVISGRVGVPPSAIVRFAKTFGFEGAGPMQRLLKDRLLASKPESAYHERVRRAAKQKHSESMREPYGFLAEFANAAALSVGHVTQTVGEDQFNAALELISKADMVLVTGFRRSFAIAAYLTYSLQQSAKRCVLVDGSGGLAEKQLQVTGPADILVVVSFEPYAAEAVSLAGIAASRGVPIVAITDSVVSPVAKSAQCVLQVKEARVLGFRTIAASMCLAQSLAIAYASQAQAR
jgi:DNA-binding MurR/RpiR family transcriptional regulator